MSLHKKASKQAPALPHPREGPENGQAEPEARGFIIGSLTRFPALREKT